MTRVPEHFVEAPVDGRSSGRASPPGPFEVVGVKVQGMAERSRVELTR